MIVADAAPMISDTTRSLAGVGGQTNLVVAARVHIPVLGQDQRVLWELSPNTNTSPGCFVLFAATKLQMTVRIAAGPTSWLVTDFPQLPIGNHSVVWAWDTTRPVGSQQRMWADGLAGTGTATANNSSQAERKFPVDAIRMLHRGSGGLEPGAGTLMSVPRVWNRALTDEQCRRLSIGW